MGWAVDCPIVRARRVNCHVANAMKTTAQQGRLFVVSAPSGTGKTTITGRLQEMGAAQVSVSHTTRPPREGEIHGKNYFFVDDNQFAVMRDADKFLEWAEVYGYYYGTAAEWVRQQLQNGGNIILELDVQGARQVKKVIPQAVLIFICPPSLEVLAERLRSRGKDSAAVIAHRLSAAADEMRHRNEYNHVIINNNLEQAVAEVCAIVCGQNQSV